MDYEGDAPQEYEQIPWSHLVPVQRDRSMQLALVVVAAIALLLAGLFVMRRGPGPDPIVAATTVAPISASPSPLPAEIEVAEPPPATSPPEPQIYSEADLMAVLPPNGDMELMAVARAELFVADYFTIDGDGGLADRVGASLPDAVVLPQSDGSLISYVEWVRAVAVKLTGQGAYVVTVWFRTLVGNESGGFSRTDVRAVDVELEVDGFGRLAIADLPAVTTVASAGIADPWPEPVNPPPEIVGAGVESLADFGSSPELTAAGQDQDGWRLLFAVGDASGLRFPLVVRIPAEK